jgi:hypothetical protein
MMPGARQRKKKATRCSRRRSIGVSILVELAAITFIALLSRPVRGFQPKPLSYSQRLVHDTRIIRYATPSPEPVEDIGKEQREENVRRGELGGKFESALWLIPWVNAYLAFESYEFIARHFHAFLLGVNSIKWGPEEEYGTSIIVSVLNGPLSASLSITFGTLVAVTVSTLYERQQNIQRAFIDYAEEARVLKCLLQGFPEDKRKILAQKLDLGMKHVFDSIRARDISVENIRKRNQLPGVVKVLTEVSSGADVPRVIDDSFASVRVLLSARSSLLSEVQSTFPAWHYITLASLALAISLVFLFDANGNEQLYQAGFQLRLCWGVLFWVWSMLAVLIYDLSSPLTGFFKVRPKPLF